MNKMTKLRYRGLLAVALLALSQVVAAVPSRTSVLMKHHKHRLNDQGEKSSVTESLVLVQPEQSSPAKSHHHHHDAAHAKKKALFVSSMAFIAGFMDVIFFRRYGCYVNMMTGNTIRLSTALAESRWLDASFSISLITSYSVGVAMVRLLHNEKHTVQKVAPIVMAVFGIADVVSRHASYRIHAPLFSLGFGLVNAVSADATGGTILFAMTGHLTRLSKSMVDYFIHGRKKACKSIKTSSKILTSFILGIVLSVKAVEHVWPLLEAWHPPLVTLVGAIYALLLLWYGQVAH